MHKILTYLQWLPLLNKTLVKNDTLAGITAGILILPQAIAFATIAGLPPEYGLYTAIFPVIIAAIFGSSWHVLSGPNTALAVMMPFALTSYATMQTTQYISYAITLTLMVGLIQLLFALFRIGKLFIYFSHTVLLAITSSIGIIIILKQFTDLTGIEIDVFSMELFESFNIYTSMIGGISLLAGLLVKRYMPKLPYLIVAIFIGMILFYTLELFASSSAMHIKQLGAISLTSWSFSLPDIQSDNFLRAVWGLWPWAILMAMMGLIQSVLIAKSSAKRSGQTINMDREVVGQSVSNIAGSFLSCFPSAGSFNRSASNMEVGGQTPLVALVSALFLVLLVLVAEPFISDIPMAVMAGLLILVGMSMIKLGEIKAVILGEKRERMIFLTALFLTLFAGFSYGILFGLVLSTWTYFMIKRKKD